MLFDVFQTIVDFDGDHITDETWQFMSKWCRYRRVHIDPDELHRRYRSSVDALAAVAPGNPPDIDVLDCWEELLGAPRHDAIAAEAALTFRQITTRSISQYPGTSAVLDALNDLRLGIVSNTQRAYTESELAMLDLAHRFEAVVFSSDVRAAKPDPAPFHRALELMNAGPDDCVYVGDNPYDDVVGARRLGIPVVLIEREHPRLAEAGLPEPDARVVHDTPAEIVRAVRGLIDG